MAVDPQILTALQQLIGMLAQQGQQGPQGTQLPGQQFGQGRGQFPTTVEGFMNMPQREDSWKDFFIGKTGQPAYLPQYTGMQQAAFGPLLASGLNNVRTLQSNQFDFEPIAQDTMRRFNQQIVPSIAERFNAQGGLGSGEFAQTLKSGATDLASTLGAQKQQYNLQQRGLLGNEANMLLQLGLSPQFQTMYSGTQPGVLGGLLNTGARAAGAYFGAGI